MKLDKNKIIIPILGLALVGTSTVTLLKIDRISNDEKGAESMSITSEQKTTENTTQEITIAEPSTTKPKSTTTTQQNKAVVTPKVTNAPDVATTQSPYNVKEYTFISSLGSEKLKIKFVRGTSWIDGEGKGVLRIICIIENNADSRAIVDRARMSITDENGNNLDTLDVSDIYLMKFPYEGIRVVQSQLRLAVTSQTKAVHLSYTFDDGTTASTVLSLA